MESTALARLEKEFTGGFPLEDAYSGDYRYQYTDSNGVDYTFAIYETNLIFFHVSQHEKSPRGEQNTDSFRGELL